MVNLVRTAQMKKGVVFWNYHRSLFEGGEVGTGSSSLILLSEIGLCRGTGSYFALNQSGMTTALRSSWIVMPRALASSLSNENVCSPKATMTLYDIFVHAAGLSTIPRLYGLEIVEVPIV